MHIDNRNVGIKKSVSFCGWLCSTTLGLSIRTCWTANGFSAISRSYDADETPRLKNCQLAIRVAQNLNLQVKQVACFQENPSLARVSAWPLDPAAATQRSPLSIELS